MTTVHAFAGPYKLSAKHLPRAGLAHWAVAAHVMSDVRHKSGCKIVHKVVCNTGGKVHKVVCNTGGKFAHKVVCPTAQVREMEVDVGCPQTRDFEIVRCTGHQHIGAQCITLYNAENDERICQSCPVLGTKEGASSTYRIYRMQ